MIGGGKGLRGGEYDERDREGGDRKEEARGQKAGECRWEGGGGCVEDGEDKGSVEEEEEGAGEELGEESPYPAVLKGVFKSHHDSGNGGVFGVSRGFYSFCF